MPRSPAIHSPEEPDVKNPSGASPPGGEVLAPEVAPQDDTSLSDPDQDALDPMEKKGDRGP